MMRILTHLRTVLFAIAGLAVAGTPAFEVASIRISSESAKGADANRSERIEVGPASLTMRNVNLWSCLCWAYSLQRFQINAPPWIDSARFDIAAKAAGATPEPQLRLMLQTLLADRFKLVSHRESKEMPVLALVPGKGEPRLKESEGDGPLRVGHDAEALIFQGISMPQFAERLTGFLRTPVVDMTGLTGRYDLKLDVRRRMLDTADATLSGRDSIGDLQAAIRSAVQERLGLRIESRKAPVEILVIDSAEKTPTEN